MNKENIKKNVFFSCAIVFYLARYFRYINRTARSILQVVATIGVSSPVTLNMIKQV